MPLSVNFIENINSTYSGRHLLNYSLKLLMNPKTRLKLKGLGVWPPVIPSQTGSFIKKCLSKSFLRCVPPPKTTTILRELDKGYPTCHERVKSVVRKSLNQGYYFPTMSQEVTHMVLKCESCHRYTPRIGHMPSELLYIRDAWPFVQ